VTYPGNSKWDDAAGSFGDAPGDPEMRPVAAAPETEIVCIDCGGRAFLMTPERESRTWFVGDVVAYRCKDCLDRWDLELPPYTKSAPDGG